MFLIATKNCVMNFSWHMDVMAIPVTVSHVNDVLNLHIPVAVVETKLFH